MLVTVTAMSIIVAAFGTILVQCKRVVTISHRTMRANHRVAVITESIRRDFRRLSRDGFLYLGGSGDRGIVVLTTGDATASLLGDAEGLGSFVLYAITGSSTQGTGTGGILLRPEYVLTEETSLQFDDTDKALGHNLNLHDLHARTESEQRLLAQSMVNNCIFLMPVPPDSMQDASELWRVLSNRVESLSVAWTDGRTTEEDPLGDFVWHAGDSDIWTSRNAGNWPMAVRVSYSISDPDWPEGFIEDHQVICDVLP